MLTKLTLTHFRKVISDEMTFTPGLNIIRGSNEASKSTRIEAILYALFGASALRTSLEDTVTWGYDPKSLRVDLDIVFDGKTYTFSRSKGGAEVTLDGGVFCTGQKEVSGLAARLLGADAGVASRLLVANQGAVRGALEEGGKALSLLIEELAGFDAFDRILEAAQDKLALGSPALFDERLKGAKATLEAVSANLPAQPDLEAHSAEVTQVSNAIANEESKVKDLTELVQAAKAKLDVATSQYADVLSAQNKVDRAAEVLGRAVKQAAETFKAAQVMPDYERLQRLQLDLDAARQFDRLASAYAKFDAIPQGPRMAISEEEFSRLFSTTDRGVKELAARLSALRNELASVTRERINHDKCDKCGQDVTHLATVIETNKRVDGEIIALTSLISNAEESLEVQSTKLASLVDVQSYGRIIDRAKLALAQCKNVVWGENTYPALPSWIGDVPANPPDIKVLEQEVKTASDQVKLAESNRAKYEYAVQTRDTADKEHFEAQAQLAALDAPEAAKHGEYKTAYENAVLELLACESRIKTAKAELLSITEQFNSASALWSMANSRIVDAKATIAQCEADLTSLAFNNGLVKKIRAIRPEIAAKVWNVVLSSVSVMFSQIRGTPSVVVRDAAGFKVNNQSISSLSGSTVDCLGIALRNSLVKIFIPQCDFMIFDEPFAAMDTERTLSSLGALRVAGVPQIILITHEDFSESVSEEIIEV